VSEIRRILTERGNDGIAPAELYALVRAEVERDGDRRYGWTDFESDLDHLVIARKVSRLLQDA